MLQKRTKVVFLIFALFVFTQTKHNKSKQDTFYKHGAVASDSGVCSDIGVNAMKDKGTAVDAAIATLFCLGLIHPHSSGIGGGGFMLIYQRSKKKATFLDFRETAPAGSTYDNMFVNKTDDTVQLQGKEKKIKIIELKHGYCMLTGVNTVEQASMKNVELVSMNKVELASMNKIELSSQHVNKVVHLCW